MMAAVAGLSVAGCDRVKDPYALIKPKVPGPQTYEGEEHWVSTSCAQCPVGCGINVRVVENRAVHIEGNPNHPVNHGGVGPRGQSGLDVLYAPNRVRQPLRRRGPRGSGDWEPISWQAALSEVGEKLAHLREAAPERLVVLSGRERGVMRDLFERFAHGFGTPNFIEYSRQGPQATLARAMHQALGVSEFPGYDLAHAGYVLSLGSGLLEGGSLGCYGSRARAQGRHRQSLRRLKMVQVEPAYSLSAAAADEWIAANPGTLDVCGMAIAHVLIEEGLFDKAFVEKSTFGFEAWTDSSGARHPGFAELARAYTPERAEQLTGVRAETVERIAKELAENGPGVVLVDDRSTSTSNGLSVARVALALNALLGSLGGPGGLLVQRPAPLRSWKAAPTDATASRGLTQPRMDGDGLSKFPLAASSMHSVFEATLAGKPYPPEALLLYYVNPFHASSRPAELRQALARVPMIVSFSPFDDETASLADYVLPDFTYLERLEDAPLAPSIGTAALGLRKPVVTPLYDTRHTGDVLIALAQKVGRPVADAFPWKSFQEALVERLGPDLFKKLSKTGFWVDDSRDPSPLAFETPSRKFEFFSQQVAEAYKQAGNLGAALASAHAASLDGLALGEPIAAVWEGEKETFPFTLLPYYPSSYATGGPPLPHLNEVGDPLTGARWTVPAELNPKTARGLGIGDGAEVWVTSSAGRVRARVKVFEGIPPGSVRMAMARMSMGQSRQPDIRDLFGGVTSAVGELSNMAVRVRLEAAT
jgi:anaerobic selenocysteine-containing dehydrogenase